MSDKKEQSSLPQPLKYWAFISYSHTDETWARWLHRELETYRVPRALVGRQGRHGAIPAKLFPVFRDREELPSAADLSEQIQEALRLSWTLIVICSPKSARSKWVNEEIRQFKSYGREDRIFSFITDGEPNASDQPDSPDLECFPTALRFRVTSEGDTSSLPREPLAADARQGKDGKKAAKIKLLAGILDVGLDELRRREFQSQRLRWFWRSSLYLGMVLIAILAYVLVADLGAHVPIAESIRHVIDRHELTVFRPVHSPEELREAAARSRRVLLDELWQRWKKRAWDFDVFDAKAWPKVQPDAWLAGQIATSVLRFPAPDASERQRAEMVAILDDVFAAGVPVEEQGKKYGWRTGLYTPDGSTILGSETSAGATLWLAAAYSLALSRPGTIAPEKRGQYETRLAYVQETSQAYRVDDAGGWNRFANQFKINQHSTYMSTLALLALLETRTANLPWEGSTEKRDALLSATARWLIDQFVAQGDQTGWRGAPEDTGPVSDGLTLQIYSELLRAEEEAGVKLPEDMLIAIGKHVDSLVARTMEYPETTKTFMRLYTTPEGTLVEGLDSIIFIWHAWGIETCVRWVRRLENHGASRDSIVRARRALGHLVLELGDEATKRMISRYAFPLAETLYALSSIALETHKP